MEIRTQLKTVKITSTIFAVQVGWLPWNVSSLTTLYLMIGYSSFPWKLTITQKFQVFQVEMKIAKMNMVENADFTIVSLNIQTKLLSLDLKILNLSNYEGSI